MRKAAIPMLALAFILSGMVPSNLAVAAYFHGQAQGPVVAQPPSISSIVLVPATASITTGAIVNVTVNFTTPVTVAGGTPTLQFNLAGATASYISGSGTNALLFRYTVAGGQNTPELTFLASNALLLNGATIKDASNNNADLSVANGYNPAGILVVDTTAPVVNSMNTSGPGITNGSGVINTGTVVTFTMVMSENSILVNGPPTLSLNNGGVGQYASGNGSNIWTFTYIVVSGQDTPDLAVTAFNLNGGTIKDAAGNNAVMTAAVGNPPGILQVNTTASATCTGVNYYVSNQGNDSNNGTSPGTPWQTIGHANAGGSYAGGGLNQGQCLSFNGGQSFSGCLFLIPGTNIAGSNTNNPIRVRSYGSGNATIVGDAACANPSNNNNKTGAVSIASALAAGPQGNGPLNGLIFENLIVRPGPGLLIPFGINVMLPSNGTSNNIVVINNDVGGFITRGNTNYGESFGIQVLACCSGNTLNTVTIANNTIHGLNGVTSADGGGVMIDAQGGGITNFLVTGNHIFNHGMDNTGGTTNGGAITLLGDSSDPLSGTVSNNLIHDIGANPLSCGGVSGIETAGAGSSGGPIVIRGNEVYNVQPVPYVSGCDWDGIDLDGGAQNSIVEYNYTHHNAGSGVMGWMGQNNGGWGNNVFRYNISENDSTMFDQSNGRASMTIEGQGQTGRIDIYGNVFNMNSPGGNKTAVSYSYFGGSGGPAPGSLFENNIVLWSNGNYPMACYGGPSPGNTTYKNNNWFSPDGTAFVAHSQTGGGCFGGGDVNGFSAFESASGETNGKNVNPQFVGPIGGNVTCTWSPAAGAGSQPVGAVTGPQPCPSGYRLAAGSPMLGAGIAVPNHGGFDYWAGVVPSGSGSGFAIGADQGSGVAPPPPTPTVTSVVATGSGIVGGSGAIVTGAVVTLTANFSAVVNLVGGPPTMSLDDGGTATYSSGSGTNAFVFTYTVLAGQTTNDLTITAFNMNGSTIRNAASTNADMSGAVVNPAGTLIVNSPGGNTFGPRVAVGPQSSITCPGGAVTINPGTNIQTVVNGHGAGTSYCLTAGTFSGQHVTPQNNDTFTGQFGAIMDGSGSGKAFQGGASGVTVKNIVITNYQPGSQNAMISNGGNGVNNWNILNNEIKNAVGVNMSHGCSNCGGIGVAVQGGSHLIANYIHDNPSMAFSCYGPNDVITDNEIARNNSNLDVDPGWEAGGNKCWDTIGETISYNYSHDNGGPGIWFDSGGAGNDGATINNNHVTNNYYNGIMWEVSKGGTIAFNHTSNNGGAITNPYPTGSINCTTNWLWCAEILSSSSSGGSLLDIHDNTLVSANNGSAVSILWQNRGDSPGMARNVHVHHNTITLTGNSAYGIDTDFDGGGYTDNNFFNNDLFVGTVPSNFFWNGGGKSLSLFRSNGQESTLGPGATP